MAMMGGGLIFEERVVECSFDLCKCFFLSIFLNIFTKDVNGRKLLSEFRRVGKSSLEFEFEKVVGNSANDSKREGRFYLISLLNKLFLFLFNIDIIKIKIWFLRVFSLADSKSARLYIILGQESSSYSHFAAGYLSTY